MERVGIVGVGHAGFAPMMAGVSYKELVFEAALRAYEDAGVQPRSDVDSFVCCSEDLWEGTSIFDEYVPDQLGAALRPVQTVAADGLFALATGVMLIRSGIASVVALEAHSKASNVLSLPEITEFALDPVFERPLRLHPGYVAGLEMRRFLEEGGCTEERCAEVVVKNRRNALGNPVAAYPSAVDLDAVMASPPAFSPLKAAECAERAEGAVVVVLAREDRARGLSEAPVWVDGIGWATDAPMLSSRSWGVAAYARLGAERAYHQAGIRTPASEIDFAEVDDTFAYKQLQHLEALGLATGGEAGSLPVNVSGGSLGMGSLFEANGLARVLEVVRQLRGEAGGRQLPGVRVGLAQSWRGVPTTTGAVAVLSVDEPAT
ncbi:MAG: thiolase C-terminal domain-containing protein [Actinomycetota bacterium]